MRQCSYTWCLSQALQGSEYCAVHIAQMAASSESSDLLHIPLPPKSGAAQPVDLTTTGTKFDADKMRWDLLPWDAVEEVVYVFTIGATKYLPRNWENGMSWGRIFAALMRHIADFFIRGEERDKESGAHHLAAVAFGVLVIMAYSLRKTNTTDIPINNNTSDFKALYAHHMPIVMATKRTYQGEGSR
jgi:hypothetical protein